MTAVDLYSVSNSSTSLDTGTLELAGAGPVLFHKVLPECASHGGLVEQVDFLGAAL